MIDNKKVYGLIGLSKKARKTSYWNRKLNGSY